jgi:hypothetical protein
MVDDMVHRATVDDMVSRATVDDLAAVDGVIEESYRKYIASPGQVCRRPVGARRVLFPGLRDSKPATGTATPDRLPFLPTVVCR